MTAQNQHKIDSFENKLQLAQDDANKIRLYLELITGHIYFNTEEGYRYEEPALALARKLNRQRDIYLILGQAGRLYWRTGKFDFALIRHTEALKLAEEADDKPNIRLLLTYVGQDYADQSLYVQAINYFTQALQVADALDDRVAKIAEYGLLTWVYDRMGNYPEAIKCQYKILNLYEEEGNNINAARCLLDIAEYQETINNDSIAEVLRQRALPILEKSTDNSDLQTYYQFLGDKFLRQGNFIDALKNYEFFLKQSLVSKDKNLIAFGYYNFANTYKKMGNDTAALRNYLLTAANFEAISSTENVARRYIEAAGCLTRLKRYDEARTYFNKANVLLTKIDNESTKTDYFGGVELLDSSLGNWQSAYLNYKQYVRKHERINSDENLSKVARLSMQYDYDKKEALAKAEQEKKDTRQSTIRNSIAAGLAGALFFLIVVYRQRNKISKERNRSDELLLNILPGEVAEELKVKGNADAKHFDEVTVMFTDFKDFTKISENLTPVELVTEIDTCFKAFDHVITKYNIEKIKTIGDSYMCAGGLPVANTTNATDVVSAALEIRQYMEAHLLKRRSENKEPFEIRIGINTGPVVAGIVGVKKFAYDIWGDTVNIAARMESSGEAGKVNISGSTYALVKDKFTCTYRGKIQAKNKGEIDMYFVEAYAYLV